MLEELLKLVKEYSQEQVVDNPDIPNEQNEAVMAEASHAVAGTLQQALAQGNMQEILSLFNSGSSSQIMSSPVAQNMQAGFMDNITNKLGINKNVAMGLAATLIPMVISKMVKRTRSTADTDSGFDLNSLIGSLTGGGGGQSTGGFDIGGLISQFTGGGGNNHNSGGLDIGNVISQITSGANQQQSAGSLQNIISNFFGK